MCLLNLENLIFSTPVFRPITTHQYILNIFDKAPNFVQIWSFLQKFAQNTPDFLIWAPSSLMKTHGSLYQISRKSTSKCIRIGLPCQCENPQLCTLLCHRMPPFLIILHPIAHYFCFFEKISFEIIKFWKENCRLQRKLKETNVQIARILCNFPGAISYPITLFGSLTPWPPFWKENWHW